MSDASGFLHALAQAMSAMALYPDGHVSRDRALDHTYQKLLDLISSDKEPDFSFVGDDVIYGNTPLRELRGWEWGRKLAAVGVQRLEMDEGATRDELEQTIEELLQLLTSTMRSTSEARQTQRRSIRYGEIGLKGEEQGGDEVSTATISFSLGEEAEAIKWMHKELQDGRGLPIAEAETVVRSLSVAMHGDQQMLMPLAELRDFDEYTTTHSMNVSVLTMALAEWLGLGDRDVRAFGVAGLLHDLGKVKIPKEVLNKKGKLDDSERQIMNAHPVEGARIILSTHEDLDLAAVVAYEHHIMLDGGGYPSLKYSRDCHRASKLVHVCDVYDALRTNRPYRAAWPAEKVLAYLEERSGTEFQGEIAHAFTHMMQTWEPRSLTLEAEDQPRNDSSSS